MTKERDKEALDTLVSETYRELPALRTPDHLNQKILRMAEKKGRGRTDFLFAAWVKPVALAATIALSLAIVLQLSEMPVASVVPALAPAAREELVPQETDRLDQGEARERSKLQRVPTPARANYSPPTDNGLLEELVLKDTDPVKREAKGNIESFATSTMGFAMEIGESELSAACDEDARLSADSWLACIVQLRESGATLDAEREYEAFMLEYPTVSADSESNK